MAAGLEGLKNIYPDVKKMIWIELCMFYYEGDKR